MVLRPLCLKEMAIRVISEEGLSDFLNEINLASRIF